MTDHVTATATVPTSAAQRYAKQLASHLGRRSAVHEEGDGVRVVLTAGSCLLRTDDDALELVATAPTDADLDVVTRVVGSHLERFGQRHELQVHWQRA